MIEVAERDTVINESSNIFDGKSGEIFFKVLTNYLAKTTNIIDVKDITEELMLDAVKKKEISQLVMKYITDKAMEDIAQKTYTTGQLAKYFGVSVASINNWINEGRFKDLPKKTRYKQARISENTKWVSLNGQCITVREVVEMYNSEKSKEISSEERQRQILKKIDEFEMKYKGKYEDTLKLVESKSDIEERDADEWRFLLSRVK